MMIGGALQAPEEKTALLRLSAKELLENHRRRTFHMREDGGGLVVAEGEAVDFTLPVAGSRPRPTGVAAVPGRVFGFDPEMKYLYSMKADKSGYENIYSKTFEPYRVLHYFNKSGNEEFYCVTSEHVLQLNGNATATVGTNKGGVCAAIFHDRLFTAKKSRVSYSGPLAMQNWTEARFGAGYLETVSDEAGEILGMQPYKDKLYLFRRHGISCLRALGDELNFKVVHMPMKCGALVENSVAPCGENVGYFTDGGFYLFNGASSALAEHSRFGEIDFTKPVKAVSHCGRYYALVTNADGERVIYCYNPEQREGHFIVNGAADVAAGDELYFTRGIYAYRLTKRGISENFTPYFTAEKIALGPDGEKMLRAVLIEGEGEFRISVTSNRGTRTVSGKANEILKFRSPLRGYGFGLKIGVEPANAVEARFCAVHFRFTEDGE